MAMPSIRRGVFRDYPLDARGGRKIAAMSIPPNDPNALARAAAADPGRPVRAKYQTALEKVWLRPDKCPICDSSDWNVGDIVDVHLRGTPLTGGDSVVEQLAGIGP